MKTLIGAMLILVASHATANQRVVILADTPDQKWTIVVQDCLREIRPDQELTIQTRPSRLEAEDRIRLVQRNRTNQCEIALVEKKSGPQLASK